MQSARGAVITIFNFIGGTCMTIHTSLICALSTPFNLTITIPKSNTPVTMPMHAIGLDFVG